MAARHSNRTTGQTSTSCKLFGLSRLQALPARQTVSVTGKMRMCGRNLNPLGGGAAAAAATGGYVGRLGRWPTGGGHTVELDFRGVARDEGPSP